MVGCVTTGAGGKYLSNTRSIVRSSPSREISWFGTMWTLIYAIFLHDIIHMLSTQCRGSCAHVVDVCGYITIRAMNYFLAKTEPGTYSIEDLERDGETVWDGVHNYTAIAVIRSWKTGDRIFIYHSGEQKRIVGIAKVLGEPYENTADSRPSWVAKIGFEKKFAEGEQVSLAQVKGEKQFADFALVKQGRLSTMACPETFVEWMKKQVTW